MNKLSLDALRLRANEIASEELLGQISGGTANDCHPVEVPDEREGGVIICDNI